MHYQGLNLGFMAVVAENAPFCITAIEAIGAHTHLGSYSKHNIYCHCCHSYRKPLGL
jgi:hypothetical protein